ncbi:MAG TPA: DUF1566 domain-containing protein [Gammaproteobacteria bacterium]|nr:DUF1566 domain-containing protein [Gammaproteobacteria bacterium]HJP39433.1 DUF1566 domain-containing protein [Gammaproteobacteria bacterium]
MSLWSCLEKKPFTFSILLCTLLCACTASVDRESAHVWCDPGSDLCWQNPQRAGLDLDDVGLIAAEAQPYCESLVLGGYADWRVPTIDELRTLIAGYESTQPNGDCKVSFGAGTLDGLNRNCHGGTLLAGPAANGCYWKPGLTGSCDRTDVGAPARKRLETWASDRPSDDPKHWTAYVTFDTGAVGFNHNCSYADVRCVRDNIGPIPECVANDTCIDVDDYVSDPQVTADCDADVCNAGDVARVILRVPESLDTQPHQLMVFWYKEADWRMPPARPPDGGTDYNQVVAPNIDLDKPLIMTVPACTFYREKLISGEFRLFAYLQMQKGYQLVPRAGDYVWGSSEPISFPLNGNEHQANVMELDITLRLID